MIEAIVFYLFSTMLIASAIMVIAARNPVHSVLFLILAFCNASGLFILLGAEFVAMILVIVYVGAVSVLFLFVVMMLDINITELRSGFLQYLPIGALVGVILLVELGMVLGGIAIVPEAHQVMASPLTVIAPNNTKAIGQLLYTHYVFAFQTAGLILLVAMIGAIVLTHRKRPGIRHQKIADQNARQPNQAMEIRHVTTGAGLTGQGDA